MSFAIAALALLEALLAGAALDGPPHRGSSPWSLSPPMMG
jgi:hypothetical protein